jgi:hypothetical protein
MALTLDLDVVWPDGRRVHVRCSGWALLGNRGDTEALNAPVLSAIDVTSAEALHTFLRRATRAAAAGEVLEVGGLEPTVLRVLDVLDIVGPPPRPIVVRLAAA